MISPYHHICILCDDNILMLFIDGQRIELNSGESIELWHRFSDEALDKLKEGRIETPNQTNP